MKTLTKITLLGAALSVIIHGYLAYHYYPVKFGFSSGPAMCDVNNVFSCSAVAASQYSAFLGIPLAVWGLATNAVIFVLVLAQWWGWSDHPERLRRWALVMLAGSVGASIVMAFISTRLHNYCLFCVSLYFISFVMLECYRRTLEEPFFANLGTDLTHLWDESKGIVVAFAAVPAIAWVGDYGFLETYGVQDIEPLIGRSVSEWKSNPQEQIQVQPSLSEGPAREQARMIIAEFADFRCHHCKNAYPSVENFSKSHPDVRIEFFNFPLDGDCNEGIPPSGISCRLAAAVQCADKQGFGWALHHAIYDAQEDFLTVSGVGAVDEKLNELSSKLGLNQGQLMQCLADPATMDAVRMQAKQGRALKIQGTPTIFANGRMLPRGQLIPVLEAALDSIK